MSHDVVIVGAGIAGLYAAYLARREDPSCSLIVLEAGDSIGGRVTVAPFAGTTVVGGAGIGRRDKDARLQQLCAELGVPVHEFMVQHAYAPALLGPAADLEVNLARLRRSRVGKKGATFQEYGERVLGKATYAGFAAAMGYSDFNKGAAKITLESYGLEDNLPGWTGLHIPWGQLLAALVARIGRRNIRLSCPVTGIRGQTVTTAQGGEFVARCRVVCAIPAAALRRVLPAMAQYKSIHGQPFIRVYAQFSKASRGLMAERVPMLTVVPAPLQEIIPMDAQRGVYMVAYADNESALEVRAKMSPEWCAREVERALGLSPSCLAITRQQAHFWEAGTHYYDEGVGRRDLLLNPAPNLYVVGEAVSANQGWVEGALETVHAALANKKYT